MPGFSAPIEDLPRQTFGKGFESVGLNEQSLLGFGSGEIEGARRTDSWPFDDVQIDHGGLDAGVAHGGLDGPNVGSGFEEVGAEGLPEGMAGLFA